MDLGNLTKDNGGREGEKNRHKQRGSEANHNTLKYREQTKCEWEGEGEGKWVMDIEEGICWDEQWGCM